MKLASQPAPNLLAAQPATALDPAALAKDALHARALPAAPGRSLRVVIADAAPDCQAHYNELLGRLGHHLCIVRTGPQLIEQCRLLQADALVARMQLPVLDGVAAANEVCRERPLPVVLVTDSYDAEVMGRALENPHVLAVLQHPLRKGELAAAVTLAIHRFQQLEECRQEVAAMQRTLEERKLIERAKGTVMRRTGLDEAEAYRRLRMLSSKRNVKLIEVAQAVLAAETTFTLLEQVDGHGRPGFGSDGRNRTERPHVELDGPHTRTEPPASVEGA